MIMRTKTAYILFLFLAAFILNAHMIIPHDHHQTESDLCKTSVPFQKNSSHHPGFPLHCHAFNDLDVVKAISYSAINHFPNVQYTGFSFTKETETILAFSQVSFIEDSKKPLKSRPSDFYSLRAPPAIF